MGKSEQRLQRLIRLILRIRIKSQESLHLCRQIRVRTDTGTEAKASLGSEYRESHKNQRIQIHEGKTMSSQLLGVAEWRSWTPVGLSDAQHCLPGALSSPSPLRQHSGPSFLHMMATPYFFPQSKLEWKVGPSLPSFAVPEEMNRSL